MSATVSRLVTQPERLEAETAAELRQLVTNFPGLPERARGEIVAAIDRRTAARHAWTFVMLRACLKIQALERSGYFLSSAIPMAPVWPLLTSCSGFRQSDPEQRNPANSIT